MHITAIRVTVIFGTGLWDPDCCLVYSSILRSFRSSLHGGLFCGLCRGLCRGLCCGLRCGFYDSCSSFFCDVRCYVLLYSVDRGFIRICFRIATCETAYKKQQNRKQHSKKRFFHKYASANKKVRSRSYAPKNAACSVATQYNIPKTRAYYNKAYVFTNSKVCFLFVIIKLCRKIYYSKKRMKKAR